MNGHPLVDWLAGLGGLTPATVVVLGLVYALLVVATVVSAAMMKGRPDEGETELERRVSSWWWMILLITLALASGRCWAVAFFAFISFLALKEYLSITRTPRAYRLVLLLVYAAIPIQGWLTYTAWYGLFVIFVPVYMFIVLPTALVLSGETKGFLASVGTLHWGLMTTVYSVGHVGYLLVLPKETGGIAEGAGLVVALLVLTEANDVAQYIAGKSFGRRKIVPKVSPGKTWGGFLGGLVATAALAAVLMPVLTPFDAAGGALTGGLIAIAGFFGDLTESALKRDLGRKDSGSWIPGHGGILDRIDSLIFTAPLFLHVLRYFHAPYW
ncbi:MAG: phosphatidate cytidylyltransferase [Hyphomicrobiaceae bacterium]